MNEETCTVTELLLFSTLHVIFSNAISDRIPISAIGKPIVRSCQDFITSLSFETGPCFQTSFIPKRRRCSFCLLFDSHFYLITMMRLHFLDNSCD